MGMRNNLYLIVLCTLMTPGFVWGWGTGHETVARETLRVLPGPWGERLRAGEGGKLFLKSSHGPDDMQTKLEDCAEYLDEELRARLADPKGKPAVMYRFHGADARCELIRAMARAMKADNEMALGFLLANFNHSVADTVSANHSPLIQLVTYNWAAQGLPTKVAVDCAILEKTSEGKAILQQTCDALDLAWTNPAPASVWLDVYGDELMGTDYYRYDVDFASGGEPALKAFAAEAAFAVRRTYQALQAAEQFAALPAIPDFDVKVEAKRAAEDAKRILLARDARIDSITQGLWPAEGKVPEIGVVYDPTGFWTRGLVFMANRVFAAQVCTTLKKSHDAGLLDIREIMKKGVPAEVKTLVVPGSGLGDHNGLKASDFTRAVADFCRKGGRLVWIGGSPRPPEVLFPEAKDFTANPAKSKWAAMRGPVAADDMPGGALVLADARRFPCLHAPKGTAGWYWQQLELAFLPPATLPTGGRSILSFETKDGVRSTVGYSVGKRVFLPAFALYPYVFTDEKPSVVPLKLELDAAGTAVLFECL